LWDYVSKKSEGERVGPEGQPPPVAPRITAPSRMQTYDDDSAVQRGLNRATLMQAMPFLLPGLPDVMSMAKVPPGALGPGMGQTTNNDNKQISFNQTNSVSVQVQDDAGLANRITSQIASYTGEMFSGIARDLGRSSPRTEAAVG
jgi:hypothetical protein